MRWIPGPRPMLVLLPWVVFLLACGSAGSAPATPASPAPPPPPSIVSPPAAPALRGDRLAMGDGYACVAARDGSVWCWGSPRWRPGVHRPFQVPGIADAVSVAVTSRAVCALTTAREAHCHGLDLLSDDTKVATRRIGDAADVVEVAGGGDALCYHRASGTIACAVSPSRAMVGTKYARPVLDGVGDVVRLEPHCNGRWCAILRDGSVVSWVPWTPGARGAQVTPMAGISDAIGLTDATNRRGGFCFVRRDGAVLCQDEHGGAFAPGGDDGPAVAAASAYATRCSLLASGDVACIGQGSSGELGDGLTKPRQAGRSRLKLGAAELVTDGGVFCALLRDDRVVCWGGDRGDGYFGDGTDGVAHEPSRVALSGPAHDLDVDQGVTCAALASSVECWGRNVPDLPASVDPRGGSERISVSRFSTPRKVFDGAVETVHMGPARVILHGRSSIMLGRDPDSGEVTTLPAPLAPPRIPENASGFTFHRWGVVSLSKGGHLETWTPPRKDEPNQWEPIPGLQGVALSNYRLLRADGTVLHLEVDQIDQRGAKSKLDVRSQIEDVALRASAIASPRSGNSWCVLTRGSSEPRCLDLNRPVDIAAFAGLRDVKSIAIGGGAFEAACIVLADGSVRCADADPHRGYGRPSPVVQDVSALRDARKVVVGESHACALSADGSVHCWGSNRDDRVGPSPVTFSAVPIPIPYGQP